MTALGWKTSMSCLIVAAGRSASSGRMAGPVPSSARREGPDQPAGVATPDSSTACSGRPPSSAGVAGRAGLAGLSTVVGGKRSHGR